MKRVTRRRFLAMSAAGMAAGVAGGGRVRAEDGIVGHGAHRFRVVPGWGGLDPERYPVNDCHAMVQDARGRIILLNTNTKNNVIIYDKAGNLLETWGRTYPGAHGLALAVEDGWEVLYITDHDRHQVIKTTLDGQKLRVIDFPESPEIPDAKGYKPTDVAVLNSGYFFVTDGYGTNYIIKYGQPDTVARIFGGKNEFMTPHGICVDARHAGRPTLLVASREAHEIKRFTLDGDYVDKIALPGARVCDILVHGDDLYVPSLNGFLVILNKNNRVVSVPGGHAPVYDTDGVLQPLSQADDTFIHPHNVLVDDEGDVYVPQWNSGHGYPVKLARLR